MSLLRAEARAIKIRVQSIVVVSGLSDRWRYCSRTRWLQFGAKVLVVQPYPAAGDKGSISHCDVLNGNDPDRAESSIGGSA
jgi:hypothetical protein